MNWFQRAVWLFFPSQRLVYKDPMMTLMFPQDAELDKLASELFALLPHTEIPDELQSKLRFRFNKARGDLMSGDAGSTLHSVGHGIDLLLAVAALEDKRICS